MCYSQVYDVCRETLVMLGAFQKFEARSVSRKIGRLVAWTR